MKFIKPLFLFLVLCLSHQILSAQNIQGNEQNNLTNRSSSNKKCVSDDELQSLKSRINKNIKTLQDEGEFFPSSRSIVRFSWPLRQASGTNDPSYYYIGNYVDVDNRQGVLQDYNCGRHTYDGHRGTDITTWPFPEYKQDNNLVEVIAAASGTIVDKTDGYFDENCVFGRNLQSNSISIRHSDGSISIYLHLKKWSLTNKQIGSYIQEGEYLGVVGSSGNSSDPHLHFEVWADQSGRLIDPYSGSCNNLSVKQSWGS